MRARQTETAVLPEELTTGLVVSLNGVAPGSPLPNPFFLLGPEEPVFGTPVDCRQHRVVAVVRCSWACSCLSVRR